MMVSYRAYTSGYPSPYQEERNRAERQRQYAIANRCTGRRKSTATNPLPHVYQPVGGDCMGCKHCPRVRQLTNAEYHAKYGVDRPRPAGQPLKEDWGPAIIGSVIIVIVVGLILLLGVGVR